MTFFDIEEKAGVWFDIEGGGKVQLRTLTADDMKAIRKQTVKKEPEYKRIEGKAERFEVEKINEDLQNELFWDRVIVAWENLFDSKKKPIPCTSANKVLLMSRSMKFAKFIGDSLKTLAETETAEVAATEKN